MMLRHVHILADAIWHYLTGVFEHYTTLHQYDANLSRFSAGIEWLAAYDLLSSAMRSEQEYALMGYMAYSIVPVHKHFAAVGNPKVERPNAYWEVKNQSQRLFCGSFLQTAIAVLFQDEIERGDIYCTNKVHHGS